MNEKKLKEYGKAEMEEEIESREIEDYVADEDYVDYLKAVEKRKREKQLAFASREGVTNVPDGIYMMGFEEFSDRQYGDIAPLVSIADDLSIDLEFLKQIRPGVFAREGAKILEEPEGLTPDY
jgi:hypothetical protein